MKIHKGWLLVAIIAAAILGLAVWLIHHETLSTAIATVGPIITALMPVIRGTGGYVPVCSTDPNKPCL